MKTWSPIFVALAALCWGLAGGVAALLMSWGWDAFVVSFYRGAVGFAFVLGWLLLHPQKSGLGNRRLWLWSALAGLGIAGNFVFYFVSISEGSVAVAATLMYCAPVFVYFISVLLKIEDFSMIKAAAIGLVLIGVVLLTRLYGMDGEAFGLVGVGTGLLAGFSYALFIFGFKYASKHGSPQSILAVAFATVVAVLLWLVDRREVLDVLATVDWPLFAALGVLGAGLSFILYFTGLKNTAPTTASVVAMVEPVVASLFGILVLSENLVGIQIFGMILILVAVTALSIYTASK